MITGNSNENIGRDYCDSNRRNLYIDGIMNEIDNHASRMTPGTGKGEPESATRQGSLSRPALALLHRRPAGSRSMCPLSWETTQKNASARLHVNGDAVYGRGADLPDAEKVSGYRDRIPDGAKV